MARDGLPILEIIKRFFRILCLGIGHGIRSMLLEAKLERSLRKLDEKRQLQQRIQMSVDFYKYRSGEK